jgi:hypothetical protein
LRGHRINLAVAIFGVVHVPTLSVNASIALNGP